MPPICYWVKNPHLYSGPIPWNPRLPYPTPTQHLYIQMTNTSLKLNVPKTELPMLPPQSAPSQCSLYQYGNFILGITSSYDLVAWIKPTLLQELGISVAEKKNKTKGKSKTKTKKSWKNKTKQKPHRRFEGTGEQPSQWGHKGLGSITSASWGAEPRFKIVTLPTTKGC